MKNTQVLPINMLSDSEIGICVFLFFILSKRTDVVLKEKYEKALLIISEAFKELQETPKLLEKLYGVNLTGNTLVGNHTIEVLYEIRDLLISKGFSKPIVESFEDSVIDFEGNTFNFSTFLK